MKSYSEKHFYLLCDHWDVDREYSEPMFNYLIYGLSPGLFFTYILCNDWANAILSSHPANRIANLKNLTKWMINVMPSEAWGSSYNVKTWLEMPEDARRFILERDEIILTPEQETWAALNDT